MKHQKAALSAGRILKERYRIEVRLGQGGMGAVYRAWDLDLQTAVAVKENLGTAPLGNGVPEAERQFEREAHILDNLSHPNLPHVRDHFFVPAQGQYLVMDFVEGEDLQTRLEGGCRMSEPEVLAWAAQICSALAYLHGQTPPIIHHDLKPANIKICPDGKAMLVDFGIAGICDPTLSAEVGYTRIVTPGYSPPEQYGGVTDARSDVYALGATLYHVLTGRKPPPSPQRVWGSAELPPPRHLNPRVSPRVEQAILKAMDTAVDRRFQSMAQFQSALLSRAPEGPAVRKPASGLAQWWPLLVAVLAVLALAVLAALVPGLPVFRP
ncbi:MAG: serine/threonine protein kinase [Thermoflexales bacterium]|nr:serine/threonine protein kinase [Thermoflexales bacterium]